MARKSFVELQADLLTSFPDNITGAITPLVLRTYFNNFLEAIRPAYGLISRPTPTSQTLGTIDAPLVFDTGYVSDVPDFSTTPAAGTVTRLEAGTTRLTFNATVEAGNGRLINFTVYRAGVALPWKASVTAQGAGKPVDVSIAALSYLGSVAAYQIQARADTAGTVCTFSNMDLLCETVPVNAY